MLASTSVSGALNCRYECINRGSKST